MADPVIRCGLVEQGRSNLKFHAIRADGTAACSSHILVVPQPFSAASIPPEDRCNSTACRKLFAMADQERAEAFAHG